VICATGAPHTILDTATVGPALAARPDRPLVLIDLAVPRDVDPSVRDLPGCTLHDIDDLERVVSRNRSARADLAPAGEEIVADEAARFRRWRDSLDVVPAIAGLRALAEQVRSEELAKVESRWEALTPRDRALVDRLTRSIVNKLLHEPTVRLRHIGAEADAAELAATVTALFDLPRPEAPAQQG
jgi:glutamyl-tRNA reductase